MASDPTTDLDALVAGLRRTVRDYQESHPSTVHMCVEVRSMAALLDACDALRTRLDEARTLGQRVGDERDAALARAMQAEAERDALASALKLPQPTMQEVLHMASTLIAHPEGTRLLRHVIDQTQWREQAEAHVARLVGALRRYRDTPSGRVVDHRDCRPPSPGMRTTDKRCACCCAADAALDALATAPASTPASRG